jgi:hypothetical protein
VKNPLPLFQVVIDHGLTTQFLFVRARCSSDSFDVAIRELERSGVRYAAINAMVSHEVPEK